MMRAEIILSILASTFGVLTATYLLLHNYTSHEYCYKIRNRTLLYTLHGLSWCEERRYQYSLLISIRGLKTDIDRNAFTLFNWPTERSSSDHHPKIRTVQLGDTFDDVSLLRRALKLSNSKEVRRFSDLHFFVKSRENTGLPTHVFPTLSSSR